MTKERFEKIRPNRAKQVKEKRSKKEEDPNSRMPRPRGLTLCAQNKKNQLKTKTNHILHLYLNNMLYIEDTNGNRLLPSLLDLSFAFNVSEKYLTKCLAKRMEDIPQLSTHTDIFNLARASIYRSFSNSLRDRHQVEEFTASLIGKANRGRPSPGMLMAANSALSTQLASNRVIMDIAKMLGAMVPADVAAKGLSGSSQEEEDDRTEGLYLTADTAIRLLESSTSDATILSLDELAYKHNVHALPEVTANKSDAQSGSATHVPPQAEPGHKRKASSGHHELRRERELGIRE